MKLDKHIPVKGDKAICEGCGHPIEYVEPYWRHIGRTLRHPAIPKEDEKIIREKAPCPKRNE